MLETEHIYVLQLEEFILTIHLRFHLQQIIGAVIGYEGKEYPISAGEQFRFAKGGLHSVKADGKTCGGIFTT